jgi:hypothetical protein
MSVNTSSVAGAPLTRRSTRQRPLAMSMRWPNSSAWRGLYPRPMRSFRYAMYSHMRAQVTSGGMAWSTSGM